MITSKNSNALKIVSIYHENKIIAYLPLEIKNLYFVRVLQWIGTEISDYCNPIIANDFHIKIKDKNFDEIWNDILNEIGNVDLIFLIINCLKLIIFQIIYKYFSSVNSQKFIRLR